MNRRPCRALTVEERWQCTANARSSTSLYHDRRHRATPPTSSARYCKALSATLQPTAQQTKRMSLAFLLMRCNVNALIPTLKPQSNGPFYSSRVIGTLAVVGGLLHLVQRGGAWAGWAPPSPLLAVPNVTCTKCNSPPINGQCTDFILFAVAL